MPNYTHRSTLAYLLAILGGLLSDVVAGYLAPALATRVPLTVGLFLLYVLLGLLVVLYQERKTQIVTWRLMNRIGPNTFKQLHRTLLQVREFDTVAGRQAFLQLAIPSATNDESGTASTDAGRDEILYQQIEWEGSKYRFVTNLLNTLLAETHFVVGQHYLRSLLVEIGTQSGHDVEELSQQTQIIAYTAMGLLHYVQGWPNQAQLDFRTALYCAGATEAAELVMAPQPDCTSMTNAPLPASGLLYYYLGRSLQFSGNYAQSLYYLEQAHALNPADPAALVGMGLVYQRWLNNMDAPEADAHFREALVQASELLDKTKENERGDIYYLQAIIYELLHNYAMAEERYTKAKDAFQSAAQFGTPVSPYNALVGLGRVQRIEGNYASAQLTLETAIDIDEGVPWAYLEMAKLYRETPRQADSWLKKAKRIAPTAARVFLTEAQLCNEWEDASCTEDAYTKALQLRPGSGSVADRVGTYWLGQGEYKEALPYFRQATERQPCEPWVHERIAYVFGKIAQPADAAWHYTQAIQLLHEHTSQADQERLEEGLRLAMTAVDGASVEASGLSCQTGTLQ